ncbi:MAG TPA: hypothetical protein DCY64_22550 [Hydrogenophaga sp.]|uniref:hypothetical protein n=1 Tax=Hydrogenophaga sp. TaxID=1904254 RepID=UPI0008C4A47E|nr:hypothetical protein [Hydrogenophaga sp.]OGA78766.1 MAG: hypothetical protein A2X73_07390 [Burkholderiales bacterium GWE1_65_30]OGA89337.1 MAG: hypothetical protein A2X72_16550 [Burkholderiales bacterium GWF1_66_17]HAX23053.1 hypothetical protein [Hydrogenophaga sp.]
MPTVPLVNSPSVSPTTTSGARYSAPGLVKPDAPNGARFNTRPQEVQVDTRQLMADANRPNPMRESLSRLSDIAMKVQLDAEEQANQVRVNEALNQAVQSRLALTYDPEQGYVHLQGKAALDRPDKKSLSVEYGEKYQETLSSIAAGLGNDKQRAIFMEKAGALSTQFQGGLMEHTAKEFSNHSLSVQSGTIATNIGQMGLMFGDPDALAQSVSAIKAATAEEGRLRGWSGSEVEATTIKNLSMGHATVIKSAIDADMHEFADEYFKIHKGELSNEARLTVTKLVDEGVMEAKVQRVSDGLLDKYGADTSAAMSEIREKYQGKERAEIETRVIARVKQERDFLKQRQDDVMTQAWTTLQSGGKLSPSVLAQMHPEDREKLRKYQRSRAEEGNVARKTNIAAWLAFADTPPAELAKMTAGDLLRNYGNHMSDSDLKSAQGKIVAARAAVEKGDHSGLQLFTVQDAVKTGARDLGIIPKTGSKLSDSQQEALDTFKHKIQDKVNNWEAQNPGKRASNELIGEIVQKEKVNVARVRGFFRDETKPVITMDDDDLGKAYVTVRAADGKGIDKVPLASVPASYRMDAIQRRKARGLPVTESAIAQMWVADGKPKN